MKGILSSVDIINTRVQREVDEHLYLICNYDKGISSWLSVDAQFLHEILNIYKVMIDSNYVIGRAKYVLVGEKDSCWNTIAQQIHFNNLNNIMNLINSLRSVVAHNTNEKNGFFQKKEVDIGKRWILTAVGKNEPNCVADYQNLLLKLEKISIECEQYINEFIDYIAASDEKDAIIKRWTQVICDKYTKNEKIFFGQLGDAFLALYPAKVGGGIPNLSSGKMMFYLNGWIQNYYTEKYETQIKAQDGLYQQYACKLSGKALTQFQEGLLNKKTAVAEQRDKLKKIICDYAHVRSLEDLEYIHYKKYFMEVTLPELIRKTLDNEHCSLLPQDIFQIIIQNYLADLTISEII